MSSRSIKRKTIKNNKLMKHFYVYKISRKCFSKPTISGSSGDVPSHIICIAMIRYLIISGTEGNSYLLGPEQR